ncbi:unnamed protein product, partial [Rotaria sp. Silwood1]
MLEIRQSSIVPESIIVDEVSKVHNVNYSLWYSLFTAPPLGLFGLCIMIILLVLGEILHDGIYLWLIRWFQQSENNDGQRSIGIKYFLLTMATLIVAVGRSHYFFYQILNGSNYFHNRMLSGLLHTSMRFFESNPSGRILNRVSKDQQVMDEILPATSLEAIQLAIMVIGSLIIIISINPWVIIVLILLGPTTWLLCRYYLRSSQQLQRMESISRSPVFGFFLSSINGLATIRAFKVQNDMICSLMNLVDTNARSYLYMAGAARWFCCRFDIMTTLIVLFAAIFVVILRDKLSARRLTEAHNFMTSAERIDEYACLSQEEDNGGSKGLIRTPTDWPDRGAIEFRNYSLRYQSNLDPTLKNINLAIKPSEKVGIIGRTGAGKSSLFQGLLRLVDRLTVDGTILIDDIDISRITLSHLRSHISIIPQQFVLFTGTLRSNIDPLDVYTDEQCWTALEAVQLKQMVSDHPSGLLMPVAESGSNLSVGQRQLVCICRAILKPRVDIAIERCRFLIQRTRQLFPQIKTIGWLALSPRTKPSRFYSSLDINQCYKKFNQLLYNLSNEMNFKVINANLQEQHMHQDGLHPSIESGRIIIERTLHSWFAQQKNLFPCTSTLDNHSNIPFVTEKTTQHHNQTFKSTHIQRQQIYTNNHQPGMQMYHKQQHNNNNHNNNNVYQQYYNRHNNNKTNHQHQINIKNNYAKNYQHQRNINNNNNNRKNNYYDHSNIKKNHRQYSNIKDNNNNDENNFQYPSKKNTNNIQSNILIDHYPHFLRHRQEFYRKIEIPNELENKKEDIFHLTNIHFKAEYLRLEATKWKTYVIAASNKRQSKERKDHMKTIIEINNSLPIARPSPTGLAGPPAPLDLSDFAELFDEWLPDPVPGQKRKLGHRRDDPPTPPSPRQQPPPIIPRKTLPPRNPSAPLIGGSLRASPISNEITKDQKQQHSFHALFPIEKQKQGEQQQQHIRTPNIILPPTNEQSMTISPLLSSTPEPMIRSPS